MVAASVAAIQQPELPSYVNNLIVESGLVHARILDEFFGRVRKSGRVDDVFAVHYTARWKPRSIFDASWRTSVNKRLQHLTTARIDGTPRYPFAIWYPRAATYRDELVEMIRADGDHEMADALANPLSQTSI